MMIDAHKVSPFCRRCGYVYDEKYPSMAVILTKANDGSVYAGCKRCFEDLSKAQTAEQKQAIINAMKVVDN